LAEYIVYDLDVKKLKDTSLRIYQAVQTIADIEDRSLNEVVADIEKVKASQ
jgi:hypothetical protein